jgi:DNA-binding NarL/FixJ family response regulator
MCRALKVLCAAPGQGRLAEVKRAVVSAHWELVGGARTTEDLVQQLDEWEPDVVVVDLGLGREAADRVRESRPGARVVTVGAGGDAETDEDVKAAILGLPRPGGPVRG